MFEVDSLQEQENWKEQMLILENGSYLINVSVCCALLWYSNYGERLRGRQGDTESERCEMRVSEVCVREVIVCEISRDVLLKHLLAPIEKGAERYAHFV